MKLIISLTLLTLSQARATDPGTVCIHNVNYEPEVLRENVQNPYQMVIDYDTNTLFFSYSVDSKEDSSDVFKSAYLDLKNNIYNTIPGIIGGFAAAIDKNKHQVYLGGRDGVHEYDYATHEAKRADDPEGRSIWQMFFKDKLYYTTYPDEEAYTFGGHNSTRVPGLEDTRALLVAVDNNNNLYFSNSTGLFCYKQDRSFINLGELNLNSFTCDNNNNLYFSTPEGFYHINSNHTAIKLADVDNVYGLVVEGDNNFIYGAEDKIVRLKRTEIPCDHSYKKFPYGKRNFGTNDYIENEV